VAFLGLERCQSEIAMTSALPGMGAALVPLGSPSGLPSLEWAPYIMNFLIMVQSLSLCLTGYG
jgi:hypothetical protein